jgi:uncharacterized protein YkwD
MQDAVVHRRVLAGVALGVRGRGAASDTRGRESTQFSATSRDCVNRRAERELNPPQPQAENVTGFARFTRRSAGSVPQHSAGTDMRRPFLLAALLLPALAPAQTLSEQVLELTNVARWDNGQLPPLKGHAQLDAAATLHSTNMGVRNFFMHCDPDTQSTHSARMSAAGYAWNAAGENIAAGNSTAAATMQQWMNSSGHRANILSMTYNELGVGYYFDGTDSGSKRRSTANNCTVDTTITGNFAHYWTQNLGRRSGIYPLVIAREAYRTTSCSVPLYVYGAGFATQMRFSNNAGATWSAWQAYAANTTWALAGASGTVATVTAEIRNASGSVRSASDTIRLGTSCSSGGGTNPARVFASGFEPG